MPYSAILMTRGSRARLDVPAVSTVDGSTDYQGDFDTLWVGYRGDGDFPSCSGKIESVLIEPAQ
jgi:hypothetical protein